MSVESVSSKHVLPFDLIAATDRLSLSRLNGMFSTVRNSRVVLIIRVLGTGLRAADIPFTRLLQCRYLQPPLPFPVPSSSADARTGTVAH
jgi:hypothetical protein